MLVCYYLAFLIDVGNNNRLLALRENCTAANKVSDNKVSLFKASSMHITKELNKDKQSSSAAKNISMTSNLSCKFPCRLVHGGLIKRSSKFYACQLHS